ncbi:claudin-34-like [Triplophysa rosa]|uniref:Claudin-2-like n=1 Tax=Triplophysa rosa TaxID=992332 RepID=A0A9W7TF44_TRIRA|nr:claudin-34-like [Triplophysa rosa]KAI7794919.1 putative claudin-2-like [Triplophysa rosa]
MPYLVHTAHAQFVALVLGTVGWILTIVTMGMVEWRVWEVSAPSVISSGLAWVGIWRVCFHSNAPILSENEILFCQKIGAFDPFTPPEIIAAQVLMLVAVILGLMGNVSVVYGLRNIYFGFNQFNRIRLALSAGGALFILTGVSTLVPVFWNLSSVAHNQTIVFPPAFRMPSAPEKQHIGPGIGVGIVASFLVVCSGLIVLSYRVPVGSTCKVKPDDKHMNDDGTDNPAFTRTDE